MIPKFEAFLPIFLQSINDGEIHKFSDILNRCADALDISDAERDLLLPSGRYPVFSSRVGWAGTYLKKAGLIANHRRGEYALTEDGKNELHDGSKHITVKYLKEHYETFKAFHEQRGGCTPKDDPASPVTENDDQAPQETLDQAFNEINAILADDLMTKILELSPYDFEKLIVRLLTKMGYGSPQLNENAVTKRSGDEGIDGIIRSDKLGFDAIYYQAKQWKQEGSVGRPEIQKFMGALAGQGASKGLFITTARFTKDSIDYTEKNLMSKIVLVDGARLTELMIEHDLGVSTVATYNIKRIDTDFFSDEI